MLLEIRWPVLLLSCLLFSGVAPSSEKQKLLKWIEENSEIFIMLKHWNELPLISTAWKRLKATPQVQEERRNFLKSVEYFLELSQDQVAVNHGKSVNHSIQNTATSSTTRPNVTQDIENTDTTQSIDLTTVQPIQNSTSANLAQEEKLTSTIRNDASLSSNNQTTDQKPSCNCKVCQIETHSFNQKAFLEDYETEKKWIRSQLTPVNYIFDRLKSIEDNFQVIQKSSCMTGNNESVKFNVTKSDTIISEQSQELQKRIGNLETLTTTFSAEYHNLSSMVMSIQESTKSATENLQILVQHASSLNLSQRNDTEEVEYCPERLDEMVVCAEVGNSCYCFSKLQKNWTSAKEYCKKNDMFLLSLDTENETELIGNHIKNSGLPRDFYWTSGSDEATEGRWIWTSIEQNVTFENWRTNQPDGGLKENCLYLHSRDEFKWGDWICSIPQYFICEW